MYTLTAAVGPHRPNKGEDVAFLQFAFKVIKDKKGNPLYSRDIDGHFHVDAFLGAIENFYESYGGTTSMVDGHVVSLKPIISRIPAKYHKYQFLPYKIGGNWTLFLASANGKLAEFKKHPLALPKKEAADLHELFRRLAIRYGIDAVIENQRIDHSGRFLINVGIKGGSYINSVDSSIIEGKVKTHQKYFDFLKKSRTSPLFRSGALWNVVDTKSLVLRSVKANKDLVIDEATKRLLLRKLGFKSVNKHGAKQSIQHCMAVYEKALILGEVSPKLEKEIFECFGADAGEIKTNKIAARAVCLARLKSLLSLDEELVSVRSRISDLHVRLKVIAKEYDVEDQHDIEREVNERLQSIALDVLSFGRGKAIKSIVKATKKSPKKAEAVDSFAGEAVSTAHSSATDNLDLFALVISGAVVVATVALVVVTSPLAALVATIVVVVTTLASIAKSVIEIVKLKRVSAELKEIASGLIKLVDEKEDILERVSVVITLFEAEGCDKLAGDILAIIDGGELKLDTGGVFTSYAARKAYLTVE